ncbi:MAG: homoserine O-succinyltransferase [Anaerofustis sp.]
MPVKISDALPAKAVLEQENIFVMTNDRAEHQDIRALRLGILNLMPQKSSAETSLLRCLSNTPLQIEIDLIHTATYESKNTSEEYLNTFYKRFEEIRDRKYDGFIITGAPVETLAFEEVEYWQELCEIMDWTKTHVFSTLYICWGAQAGLYHLYDVPKHPLPKKKFGIFAHKVLMPNQPLFRGYDDLFFAPHSRHTEVRAEDVGQNGRLQLLSASDEAGVYVVSGSEGRQIFVLGHPEYEADTLANEYARDVLAGKQIALPEHYFPGNDPNQKPSVTWRSHATLLYTNWLNYYVYQETPYDLGKIS